MVWTLHRSVTGMTAIGKYGKRIAAMQGDIRLHSSFFFALLFDCRFSVFRRQCSQGVGDMFKEYIRIFFKLPVVRAVLLIKKEKLKICDITGIYKEADKVTH